MWPERHDSFGAGGNPFIKFIVPAIVVNKDKLIMLVDDLSFNPLPWVIPDIDPFSNLEFSSFQAERIAITDEVEV